MPSFRTEQTSPSMTQLGYACQLWKSVAVVVAIPRARRGCSVLYADLDAPAVELDFVDPVGTVRRTVDQQAGGEGNEVGKITNDASPLSCGQTSEWRLSD